jgi:hypothetical protein
MPPFCIRRHLRHTVRSLLVCLSLLPAACASAVTIGQRVTVLDEPDSFHERERMYLHEEIHKTQYRKLGTMRMLARYTLSGSRRLELEAEAYAAELCYLMRVGTNRADDWHAGFAAALQTYTAGRAVSRERAAAHLARAYQGGAVCSELLSRGGRQWVLTAYPRTGT